MEVDAYIEFAIKNFDEERVKNICMDNRKKLIDYVKQTQSF